MNKNTNQNYILSNSDEIDLVQLFFKILQKWEIVLLSLLVGCIIGFGYQQYLITPVYSASAMIYMRSGEKTISVQDLTLSQNLNSDYEIIFKTRPNLETVIEDLELDMSVKALKDNVSVEAVNDTRIIRITANDVSPIRACRIANKVAEYGMEIVKEIDSQVPFVIESAIVPEVPITIGLKKAIAIGGLGCAFAAIMIIAMLSILNDLIESEEDLESSFDIPVLAVVMDDPKFYYNKSSGNKEKGVLFWKKSRRKKK